jgi:hypothetical protein
MKLGKFILAAAILIPTATSFAQSTPLALNEDVSTELAHAKLGDAPSDYKEQEQNALNVKQNGRQPRQIAGMNLGRYSLAVVVPTH